MPKEFLSLPSKPFLSAKVRRFFDAYASTGRVSHACKIAGMSRETHYQKLAADPAYQAAFAEAQQKLDDIIEDEIFRRAIECESDPLLMFLARGHMPEKYRERVSADVNLNVNRAERLLDARRQLIEMRQHDGTDG
jgi:hypothetical protein